MFCVFGGLGLGVGLGKRDLMRGNMKIIEKINRDFNDTPVCSKYFTFFNNLAKNEKKIVKENKRVFDVLINVLSLKDNLKNKNNIFLAMRKWDNGITG